MRPKVIAVSYFYIGVIGTAVHVTPVSMAPCEARLDFCIKKTTEFRIIRDVIRKSWLHSGANATDIICMAVY
jgi:hypothetical protein